MQFYDQGMLLSEYRKIIDLSAGLLNQCGQNNESLMERWLNDEKATAWQRRFPCL